MSVDGVYDSCCCYVEIIEKGVIFVILLRENVWLWIDKYLCNEVVMLCNKLGIV